MRLGEAGEEAVLERCRAVLDGGGLVVLPTDTVYGLAARVDIPQAVAGIFAVKGREASKGLVVMVAGRGEAAELVAPEERESLLRLGSLWPGPLTLVARAGKVPWRENVAPSSPTLGFRVPDSPLLLRLIAATGPLAVTSANRSGGEAPASFGDIDTELLRQVDLALDGGSRGSGRPSTVVSLSGEDFEILRRGEIGEEELRRALFP